MTIKLNSRVRIASGQLGVCVGQPHGDPIVILDDARHETVFYQSQVHPDDSRVPDCIGPKNLEATYCPKHTHHLTKRIYVASSWRNNFQQMVVEVLRAAKFDVYDFKNPPENTGFSWAEVGLPVTTGQLGDTCTVKEYLAGIESPRSIEGFKSDFDAMNWADTFVLVLPCGRSAHLELGWAVGAGKRTAILLEDPCTPELMYKMVDYLAPNVIDLLGWLGVKD